MRIGCDDVSNQVEDTVKRKRQATERAGGNLGSDRWRGGGKSVFYVFAVPLADQEIQKAWCTSTECAR